MIDAVDARFRIHLHQPRGEVVEKPRTRLDKPPADHVASLEWAPVNVINMWTQFDFGLRVLGIEEITFEAVTKAGRDAANVGALSIVEEINSIHSWTLERTLESVSAGLFVRIGQWFNHGSGSAALLANLRAQSAPI